MKHYNFHEQDHEERHPTHPVRNVMYSILCFIFSLAFSYLWICPFLNFEYNTLVIVLCAITLAAGVFAGVVSFLNSHRSYFARRRRNKRNFYR